MILALDRKLFYAIHRIRHPIADAVSLFISNITAYGSLWIVVGAALSLLYPSGGRVVAFTMLVAMAVMLTVTYGIFPFFVHRSRPFIALQGVTQLGHTVIANSLPSGHTGSTVAMLVVLVEYFPNLQLAAVVFAATLMWSRVYNGMHWPSDLLAGLGVGVFSGWLGILIVERYLNG